MKKLIIAFLLLIANAHFLVAQNNILVYNMIRVNVEHADRARLAALGMEVDHAIATSKYVEFVASDDDMNILQKYNINFVVKQKDLANYYRERLALRSEVKKTRSVACDGEVAPNYVDPSYFSLGTMGGYYTYEEAFQVMDSLAANFPAIMKPKAMIGNFTTTEGRNLFWYKISDNPMVDEAEPEIMFNALHHAREAVTLSQIIYFMAYICENYATNSEIKYLVDNSEMYFTPIVNPDGYKYNQTISPNGGGMWRKNRRNNGANFGVDLNRNYSLAWGFNNQGSSPNTTSETYRGPSAASEPEIQAMQSFVNAHNFQIVQNCHSYTGLWVYPWGYLSSNCDDSAQFRTMARELCKHNSWKFGIDEETVGYSTNGTSDDWMYGDASHAKILCGTPEVGDANDGFWPQTNRILPLCREMNYFNLTSVKFLLPYAKVEDLSDRLLGGIQQNLSFELTNIGLAPNSNFTVSLIPITNNIININGPKIFTSLPANAKLIDSISYQIASNTPNNSLVKFVLKIENGIAPITDTIVKYYGNKVQLFADDCSSLNKWTTGTWGIENSGYNSATSFGDSPGALYDPFAFDDIIMTNPLSLNNLVRLELRYRVKHAIENSLDFTQVQAVTNLGFTDLCGKFTSTDINNISTTAESYTGIEADWKYESIDLDPFTTTGPLKINWLLTSDGGLEMDGIQIDDIKITAITNLPEGINEITNLSDLFLYPNPSNGLFSIKDGVNITAITTVQGQNIAFSVNNNNQIELAKGIYFVKLFEIASGRNVVRKLIVQ